MVLDESMENNYFLKIHNYNAQVSLIKNKGKFRFRMGTAVNFYNFLHSLPIQLRSKTRTLNPFGKLALSFSKNNVISIAYQQQDIPIEALAYVVNPVIDKYHTFSHKSKIDKAYKTKHELSFNYRLFHLYSNTIFYFSGIYSEVDNVPAISYYQYHLLKEKRPILLKPENKIFLNTYLSQGLNFIPWNIKLSGTLTTTAFSSLSLDVENNVETSISKGKIVLSSNYSRMLNFEIGAGIEYIENTASVSTVTFRQTINSYRSKIIFQLKGKLFANAELEYKVNNLSSPSTDFYFFNTGIRYVPNKHVEFGLSGVNVLNLKKQNWMTTSYYGIYNKERYYRQIPGNILLKARYNF
jgi:hypothetical protein